MTRARDVANIDGILTTTGDTFYASAAGTPARLGIGSTGQVLKVNGGVPTWGADGGKVLQVVSATYSTEGNSTSATYADTGLSATITPTATTSKILVMITQMAGAQGNGSASLSRNVYINVLRGSTEIHPANYPLKFTGSTSTVNNEIRTMYAITLLDSPATTSATTYKTQYKTTEPGATVQPGTANSYITLMEIGA